MPTFTRPAEFDDPYFPVIDAWMDDVESAIASLNTTTPDLQQQILDVQHIADLANTTANGKNKVYRQATMPPGTSYVVGDQWFDSDDGNRVYLWDGSAWVSARDQVVIDALNTAIDAQTSANGKNKTYSQPTAPSTGPFVVGDIWLDTSNGGRVNRWTGSAWAVQQFGTAAIAAGAIDTAQLADAAITNAKILGLDAAKLTGTLDAANRIAAGSLTSTLLANGAVVAGKIGTGAVSSTELAAGSVIAGKIAANAVTTSTIAADAVTANQIAAGSIGASEIAAGAVVAGKIAAGAVVAGTVAADAITATEIAANSITATEIAAGAIVASKIATNAVTANAIAAGTITAASGIVSSLDAGVLTSGTINAATVNIVNLNASNITAGALSASRITGNGMVLDSTTGSGIRVNHPSGSTQLEFQSVDLSTGLTTFYTVRGAVYAKRAVTAGYGLVGYDSADGQTFENDTYPILTLRGWVSTTSSNILDCQTSDNVTRVLVPRRGGLVIANNGPLATNSTRGFMSLPVAAGVPTGAPDAVYFDATGSAGNFGSIPMVWGNNNRLYAYTGGTWKSVLFS